MSLNNIGTTQFTYTPSNNYEINNQTFKTNYTTNNVLSAQDSYFEGEVKTENDINLLRVAALKMIKSSKGVINAEQSKLSDIVAMDGVTLINSIARSVRVLKGKLTIKNDNCDKPFYSLSAASEVNLKNIAVITDVGCSLGTIKAENCTLKNVRAKYGIELLDTSAESCQVDSGNLSIVSKTKLVYNDLFANKNVYISNIKVESQVVAEKDKLTATNCELSYVEAVDEIELSNTTSESVTLNLTNKKGILILKDSVIKENLTVKMVSDSVNESQHPKSYDISVSVADISLLKFANFQDNSTVLVNGKLYRYVNRQFIPISNDTVEIEIRGNGNITGDIIFNDCTGKVNLSYQVKVGGNIKR